MSGRDVFEGNHERMGAHVIENAKLAQPPPPRAGPNRLGPALAEPGCRDFKVSFIHASHALPCVYKTSLPLIYEWAGLTRGAEVVKHTLSSLDSAPQAQEGPTPRPRCSQMRAHRAASLPQVQPPSVLDCTTHTSRGLRCISESPTARVRRTRQVSSWSERREART